MNSKFRKFIDMRFSKPGFLTLVVFMLGTSGPLLSQTRADSL
jgi:hypothetical protein